MENNGSEGKETRVPLKGVSLIFGIGLIIVWLITLFVDKEDVIYFGGFMGLYLIFDAFKDRLSTKLGQKKIKILEYIFSGILIITFAFFAYQRFIK